MQKLILALSILMTTSTAFALSVDNIDDQTAIFRCARSVDMIAKSESDACFSLMQDAVDEISLLEIHSEQCGGDPQTSPSRGYFFLQTEGQLTSLMYDNGIDGAQVCPGFE